MNKCRVCGQELGLIMSLGKMPRANGFIRRVTEREYFYELKLCLCPRCFMVQLDETIAPRLMFNRHYHFISSTSLVMAQHFKEMAAEIAKKLSHNKSPFVVELGCNDGIMLKHVAARGIPHLGVEPSANVARLARAQGVEVKESFFNLAAAREIREKYGQADIICGANVMCHIEDLNSVFAGVQILLKRDGVLFFEDPYLGDIIEKTAFDQIYDEHVYYFSGSSILEVARRHDLQLAEMVPQEVHGGSMRYYLLRKGIAGTSARVRSQLAREKRMNLDGIGGYAHFPERVDKICQKLKNILVELRRKGNRIAAYGATSKSSTLLNYARLGPEIIDYVSDTTPTKINKFTPGTHIPVRSHDFFAADQPPYTLLLAWNHREEILKNEKAYRDNGGKFITYFPEVIIE